MKGLCHFREAILLKMASRNMVVLLIMRKGLSIGMLYLSTVQYLPTELRVKLVCAGDRTFSKGSAETEVRGQAMGHNQGQSP